MVSLRRGGACEKFVGGGPGSDGGGGILSKVVTAVDGGIRVNAAEGGPGRAGGGGMFCSVACGLGGGLRFGVLLFFL